MQLPVVSTQVGGIPEGVDDGVSGFLVPAGDITALAQQLTRLCLDPDLRLTMGKAGRTFVGQKFDIEQLNDQLVALYTDVRAQYNSR